MPDKSLFSKVDHIGVVVRDIDKAVEYYESLGIGPFEPLKITGSKVKMVMGKPIDIDSIQLKTRAAKIGTTILELLEPFVQHGRGNPAHGALKIVKSAGAHQQFPQDQQCPFFADNFGRLGDRAELTVARHCVPANYRKCS